MKRTMIVDDDYLVRSYLKILSAWEKAGFRIEADVQDGEEACSVLEDTEIDLVVTDISMPLVDGIELIKRIRKVDQRMYIIALSCHDEFEYVKDAMKEGADDYILKNTLNEETLYQLLYNTAKKMEERERKSLEQARVEELAKTGDHNLKYSYFNRVLAGALNGEEREKERRLAGIHNTYQNSAVVSMFLESWDEEEERWTYLEMEQYCQDFLRRLPGMLKDVLEMDSEYVEVVYLGNGIFCNFLDLSDIRKSSIMSQKLTRVASACYQICKAEPYAYRIGVSDVCIGTEALRQAYQQAREIMRYHFYDEREILYYEEGKKAGMQIPPEAQDLLERVDDYLYRNDQGGLLNACMKAGESFEREATERRLVLQWLKKLEQNAGIIREDGQEKFQKIVQVYEQMRKDVETLYSGGRSQIPENVSQVVGIAAEYVLRHYKEPIGLTEAAMAAGVNSTYLSYLFRKEMGIGFSNFLLNQRIECTKGMLKKTNLKVREVAEQSGFNDYHYFAKVFKKVTGVSPAEYRKKVNG